MADILYRLFLNNKPASQKDLDRIEEITVDQEVDMAWQARVRFPICVDESGNWKGEDLDIMEAFSRIRVEIKVGIDSFVPLIDGPVVGYDSKMESEPGRSSITLMVHDDSVYLNRKGTVIPHDKKKDHEIVKQIFIDYNFMKNPKEIDSTQASPSSLPQPVVQRGTPIKILRILAKRHEKHVYVLPGETPGESVGCFKSFPKKTDGLPPFILLGKKRNIESFQAKHNAQSPAEFSTSALRILDKKVITASSSVRDVDLLGEEESHKKSREKVAEQLLPPGQGTTVDPDTAVKSKTTKASFAFEASGSVRAQCYNGVLQPYRLVSVMAGKTSLSGDYFIYKVTHHLTRSTYSQSFELKRNALSKKKCVMETTSAGRIS